MLFPLLSFNTSPLHRYFLSQTPICPQIQPIRHIRLKGGLACPANARNGPQTALPHPNKKHIGKIYGTRAKLRLDKPEPLRKPCQGESPITIVFSITDLPAPVKIYFLSWYGLLQRAIRFR